MFSFDLKSGYHHVDIFPDHRKYLSFSWTFSCGRTRFLEFTVLAFGLSSAPYLFTKLFKPLIRKWRSEAKGIVVYLDDGLGSAAGYNNAKIASLQVHAQAAQAHFMNADVTLACERCCVTNGYLQRFVMVCSKRFFLKEKNRLRPIQTFANDRL